MKKSNRILIIALIISALNLAGIIATVTYQAKSESKIVLTNSKSF